MPRPAIVTDDQVHAVIEALRTQGRSPTGTAVRAELERCHGHRAGTKRVYRLLAMPAEKPRVSADSELLAQLVRERDAAIKRAELAELREQATQDRTANEIWELRQEVGRLRSRF